VPREAWSTLGVMGVRPLNLEAELAKYSKGAAAHV
jgi:hypothetical protein